MLNCRCAFKYIYFFQSTVLIAYVKLQTVNFNYNIFFSLICFINIYLLGERCRNNDDDEDYLSSTK